MADALLDDLDDLSDVEPEEEQEPSFEGDGAENDAAGGGGGDGIAHDGADNGADAAGSSSSPLDPAGGGGSANNANNKRRHTRLLDDPSLKSHLSAIRAANSLDDDRKQPGGADDDNNNNNGGGGIGGGGNSSKCDLAAKEEDERQHALILASNRHLSSLARELHRAHLDLCRHYHPKFPELEELLVDPHQYRAAVGIIGNEMDVTLHNDALNEILTSNQIITISVAGSTTNGRSLSDDELRRTMCACAYLDELWTVQSELVSFVESRMERWAPSVCALVGPSLAARLLAATGGLSELCRIPACNLQLVGKAGGSRGGGVTSTTGAPSSSGVAVAGMATKATASHAGHLVECDLVRSVPAHLRMRAVKAVAGKLALAARTDHVNVESGRRRTSETGRKFREELRVKFGKWEEPDRAQVVKALPKPDLTTKKRRGGRRIRRLKERFEETEMMKQANRRAFSSESGEYGDDAMGITLGMLDSKEGGAMRNTIEKRKMRQANTKASRKRAVQMSSGATNGLASSMVFTPVQGLELVNPDANRERVRQANAKWFSDDAGFQSALPKK